MCRQAGFFNINDIETAVFEYNGSLTILPACNQRPVTPADMNLAPPPESIYAEVIMDGRILEENLTRMELDLKWLQEQLEAQGYKSADEIYLGLCDKSKNLSLFPIE